MNLSEVLFLVFGTVALVGSLLILITRNVVHAAMLLVTVLLSLAAIFVLFSADFLAVVQLLVYAGGIVVLLVFGVMLTKRKADGKLLSSTQFIFPGVLLGGLILMLLVRTVGGVESFYSGSEATKPNQVETTGIAFMTEHLLAFELIAFILLVVLVGAAFIAKKQTQID